MNRSTLSLLLVALTAAGCAVDGIETDEAIGAGRRDGGARSDGARGDGAARDGDSGATREPSGSDDPSREVTPVGGDTDGGSGGSEPTTPGQCGGTRRALNQSQAEVMLVIDRSGSMSEQGNDGMTKWAQLRRALRDMMPRVERNVAFGAVIYPDPASTGSIANMVCGVRERLDVAPMFSNSAAVMTAFNARGPDGATPTYAALRVAQQHYATQTDVVRRRYVLLATDGGPNCNGSMSPSSCRCAAPGACEANNPAARFNCLDEDRTVQQIRAMAAAGIQTFVVGMAGVASLNDVMNAMAVAGGQPRAGRTRYYDARSAEALAATFTTITNSLVDCRFQLESAPTDPNLVDVRLGGRSLRRDATDGWEWADATHREIVFHGGTCEMVQRATGGEQLEAAFGCPPPG